LTVRTAPSIKDILEVLVVPRQLADVFTFNVAAFAFVSMIGIKTPSFNLALVVAALLVPKTGLIKGFFLPAKQY